MLFPTCVKGLYFEFINMNEYSALLFFFSHFARLILIWKLGWLLYVLICSDQKHHKEEAKMSVL